MLCHNIILIPHVINWPSSYEKTLNILHLTRSSRRLHFAWYAQHVTRNRLRACSWESEIYSSKFIFISRLALRLLIVIKKAHVSTFLKCNLQRSLRNVWMKLSKDNSKPQIPEKEFTFGSTDPKIVIYFV